MKKELFREPRDPKELLWMKGEETVAHHTRIFDVTKVHHESQDGTKKGDFVRLKSPEWVLIIPWFRDEEGVARFILEQQYRHGNERVTWEWPGGLVDEGEDPLVAAGRELLEETGMKGRLTLIGEVCPNAAFMSNRQRIYLAEDLELVSGQSLDEHEEIDVFSRPVSEVVENMGTGIYDNGVMMLALGYFLRYAEKHRYLREDKA